MKVLVIGGGGFIGVHLAKTLCEAGHHVRIVGRSWLSDEKWNFLPRRGWEFRQRTFRETLVERRLWADVDAVIPLPWLLGSRASDEAPIGSLGGAANILAMLHALSQSELKPLVIFPSSHLAPRPRCLYSLHKVFAEGYLDYYERVHGIPYIALRIGKAYGPFQRRGVIFFYIQNALAGRPLPVYGEGRDKMAMIYVSDAAWGLRWAIEGRFPKNRTYNLVGHNSTLTEVAETVVEQIGGSIEHVPWPELDKVLDTGDLPLGNDLVMWGWSPMCGLKEGIARTAEWIRHGFF